MMKISSKKLLLYIAIIQKLSLTKKGYYLIKDNDKEQKTPAFFYGKNKEENSDYFYFDHNIIFQILCTYFSTKQYEKSVQSGSFLINIFTFINESINETSSQI